MKNKHEYKLGNFQKRCCICKEFTPLRIMTVTNNVEYIGRAVIKIDNIDLDKCVKFVRVYASVLSDPKLTEHINKWNTGSAINEGKLIVRSGEYNYSQRTYPERTVWEGEPFNFDYRVYGLLARKSLTNFKSDKALKKNILKLFENYNEKVTNRCSTDSEYEREPCCSEACLNMWILRK